MRALLLPIYYYYTTYLPMYNVLREQDVYRRPTPIVKESNRKTGNAYFTTSCTVVVVKFTQTRVYGGIYVIIYCTGA